MADIKPAPVLLNHPLAKEFDKVSATIKQPISDGTLVQVRSLESAVHASCTTSIPVRAAATKLLAQATASTRETRPPWVQEILDSLKRVEKSIERIEAKVDQISSIHRNTALVGIGGPMKKITPLPNSAGRIPSLPLNFDPSSYDTINAASEDVLDAVLAAFSIDLPAEATRVEKVQVVYRLHGGTPEWVRKG